MWKKLMKMLVSVAVCLAVMMGMFMQPCSIAAKAAGRVAYGADIGWLSQLEKNGVTWVDDNGNAEDPLKILKDHGVDSVRLRVFVNPPSNFIWTNNEGYNCTLGFCDTTGVLYMAQRANALGMKIMIDFHYSDHFADPKYQDIPSQWRSATFAQLKTYVYDHTYYVMSELKKLGITPAWVQVGNEVNSGILLPYGSSSTNFSQLTQLLNSGYDAVKAVSSSTKVVTHLANGHDYNTLKWFFDNFLNTCGGKTDVIGVSYYPYWIGSDYTQSIGTLSSNLNSLVSGYGKEVMVCEVGGDEYYPFNTYDLLKATINTVKNVSNSKGIGVFYWEPEANSSVLSDGYKLGATSVVSKNVLKFTTAIDAFNDAINTSTVYKIINRNSGKALNVAGGSSSDGALMEQYGYGSWSSQKWTLKDAGDGYYYIVNSLSGKYLDVSGSSTADSASCIQKTASSSYSQQWKLTPDNNGYFIITNRNSGKVLDIKSKSTADGGSCIQYAANSGLNQQWTVVAAD